MKVSEEDLAAFRAEADKDGPDDHGLDPERMAEMRRRAAEADPTRLQPSCNPNSPPIQGFGPRFHDPAISRGRESEPPPLALEPDILEELTADLTQAGLIADRLELGRLVYLVSTSRHLDRPVSLVVKGPSSAGKSWPVEESLKFHPDDAYIWMTAASERAVIYDDRPCLHKHLVIAEAAGISGEIGELLIRSLLSEGRIKYDVTVRLPNGKFGVQHIERPGPTGLISTTTAVNLHPENETRFFSFTVTDSNESTRDAMKAWANAAAGEGTEKVNYNRWHELGRWLTDGDHRVVVPYAPQIVEAISPDATRALRLKRDWINILSLVKAHALLHRGTRECDSEGRIIATLDDYSVVREMVEPLVAEAAESSVSKQIRDTVEAVEALSVEHTEGVPNYVLAQRLGVSTSTASRRVRAARGYIKNAETRPRQEAKLLVGAPLPDNRSVLPTPREIAGSCNRPEIPNNHGEELSRYPVQSPAIDPEDSGADVLDELCGPEG